MLKLQIKLLLNLLAKNLDANTHHTKQKSSIFSLNALVSFLFYLANTIEAYCHKQQSDQSNQRACHWEVDDSITYV